MNTGSSRSSQSASATPFARRLAWIAGAGLLLRLAVILWVPTQPVSDFWSYYQRGLNLAQHGRYEAIPGRVDAHYPPLYSLALAAAFLLSPSLLAAKLVNCLLALATILIGAIGTRRLWGDRAGIVAACLFAFFPRSVLMTCLVGSENLFAPLFLLFVFVVIEGAGSSRAAPTALIGGTVLGLAALTRTVAYYLGALWLLAAFAARKKLRTALAEALLVVVVQHAVMLPWALWNRAWLGRLSFLNTAGGPALFIGNNPNATGDWYDPRADLEKVAPGVLTQGDLAISDASKKAAWRWMRENPRRALRLYLHKFGMIFRQSTIIAGFTVSGTRITPPWPGLDVLPGDHLLKRHIVIFARILSAFAWILVALGVLGLCWLGGRAWRTRSRAALVLAVVFSAAALYIPAVSALIAVNGRYRWPVEDLLMPVAAMLVARAVDRIRPSRGADAAPPR